MRHVYFSFHYEDIWKVNQIRNAGVVFGPKSAGFADRSLWEEAKAKNRTALERLIADGLNGTTVTAVLIGRKTASRPWVKYEIQESIRLGSALMGIHLNEVPDRQRRTTMPGSVPKLLRDLDAPVHTWTNVHDFGEWVEEAWKRKNDGPGIFASLRRMLFG